MPRQLSMKRRPPTYKGGDKLTKYIFDHLEECWASSAIACINAMSLRIKIDTGMSMGSLVPLAKILKQHTTRKIYSRVFRGGKAHGLGAKSHLARFANQIGQPKSHAFGIQLGENAYKLGFAKSKKGTFRFLFILAVYQYYVHEASENWQLYPGESGNWRSMFFGKQAFVKSWKGNVSRYLNAKKIAEILTKQLKSGLGN